MQNEYIILESQSDILQFESRTMRLVSFRSKSAPEQEFISFSKEHPAFVIGYLDQKRQYRLLNSYNAEKIEIIEFQLVESQTLTAVYTKLSGYDIDVICTVNASKKDRFVRWKISLRNNAGLEVVDVQYPFLVCDYKLNGTSGTEAILLPHGYGSGRLIENLEELQFHQNAWKQKLLPDNYREWEFCSRTGDSTHYPGMQFAQFIAYYNNVAGLYMACEDTEANVKRFLALHHEPGIRLGVAHVGDWPVSGERKLEYDTVTCSFTGDWYDAADIYREWSFKQKWFIPLHKREDIPAWLLDSPAYLTIRPQGLLDEGPVFPIDEFLPYEKCISLLEKVAEKVDAPLAVILMGWERAGSWVYPDSFPPVGGEESMKNLINLIRQHGWQAGSFCSGTRWVTDQCWNNYDGREYFEQNKGEESICRESDGSPWHENWGVEWRPSYASCLGTEQTRKNAENFVKHLMDWGMVSLQFLDQNNGSSTFPCFAHNHEHPPVPGKWMADKMKQLLEGFRRASCEAGKKDVVHSAESGLNEYCLPLFELTELRTFPPNYGVDTIPLYQYLFHECIILQGMMGNAPEPYHLVILNAVNCVLGGLPGGVLTGDGTLLDKDTNNWALWEPKVENSENAFEMIRTGIALRRGPAKDFLVYGRMLRPSQISGIKTMKWNFNGRSNKIPAVFHSAWQAPNSRFGIVFANWTTAEHDLFIMDSRLKTGKENVTLHVSTKGLVKSNAKWNNEGVKLALPPLSCAILETESL